MKKKNNRAEDINEAKDVFVVADRRKRKNSNLDARKSDNDSVNNIKTAKRKKPNRLQVFAQKIGNVQMLIKSQNGAKVLCAISKICNVNEVKECEEGVTFCVKSKHLSKIIALLDNLCYDYKIIKVGTYAHVANNLTVAIGTLLGVCVVVALILLYSSFITRVSVTCVGDDAIKGNVESILNDMGVHKGVLAKQVDTDVLQKEIASLESVSFASVTKRGTHLEVVVKSSLPKESFVDVKGSKVTAYKRAVVTRVVCEGGTAVKKYGDVVNVGDVVIDGYVEYGDSKIDCEAKGYAYGKIYYKKSVFFADTYIEKSYGEQKSEVRLSFFSKAPSTPDCPYEKCETSLEISQYGFLIPIKIYTFTFREIVTREVKNDMSENDMASSVYSSLLTELSESAKVLEKYYSFERVDGGVNVEVTIEAEELIA